MHIETELQGPGQFIYKVFTSRGALIYHGTILSVAQEMYEIGEQEELDARKAREASSNRQSD